MLRLLLNCHPDVCVPPETAFFPFLLRKAESYGDFGTREKIASFAHDVAAAWAEAGRPVTEVFAISAEEIVEAVAAADATCYAEAFAAFMSHLARREGKRIWGEKTPLYTAFLEILAHSFPNARFLALLRDPRDVAEAIHRTGWGKRWYPSLLDTGMRWRYAVAGIERAIERLPPQRILAVRYEDLVGAPAHWVQEVCRFLGLPFDAGVLRFHERAAREIPAESQVWHQSALQPISRNRIGLWKQMYSPEEVGLIELACQRAMRRWGYEPQGRAWTPVNLSRLAAWHVHNLCGRVAWTYWTKPRNA